MQYATLRTSVKENSLAEKRSRKYHRLKRHKTNEPIKKPSDVIIIIQKAYNINKHKLKLDS